MDHTRLPGIGRNTHYLWTVEAPAANREVGRGTREAKPTTRHRHRPGSNHGITSDRGEEEERRVWRSPRSQPLVETRSPPLVVGARLAGSTEYDVHPFVKVSRCGIAQGVLPPKQRQPEPCRVPGDTPNYLVGGAFPSCRRLYHLSHMHPLIQDPLERSVWWSPRSHMA